MINDSNSWVAALTLLENGKKEEFLISATSLLDLEIESDLELYKALKSGLTDSNSLNKWMFGLPPTYSNLVIWIAPVVYNDSVKYVWMVGHFDSQMIQIRQLIENAYSKFANDDLLKCPKLTPFLLYVSTIATSKWQEAYSGSEETNDFAIFQVYYGGEEIKKDVDQLLVMNSTFLTKSILDIRPRLEQVCDDITLEYIESKVFPKLDFLTKLHTELHNIGHFCGDWLLDETKKCEDYEAIEEYRACLAAVGLSFYLDLDQETRKAFAVLVTITRIFKYGLDAFLNPDKTRQVIREITSAVFFMEDMILNNVIQISQQNGSVKFSLNTDSVLESINLSLTKICVFESQNKTSGLAALSKYARDEYARIYPNQELTEDTSLLYTAFLPPQ